MKRGSVVVLVLALMLMVMAAPAIAAGGKVAYLDTQAVFDKTKLGKKYQGILKEYYDSRKKILDMDADDIQKARDDYQKQSAVLKPDARKQREDEIGKKISDFEKKRSEFNDELSKKNEELSNEFNQAMMTIVKSIAKKDKISIVLNRSISVMQKGDVPSVLYGDDDLDLTDKTIAEMDKNYDSSK